MNIPELTKLQQDLEDRAVDIAIDMYHDHMAHCEPLDTTEIQYDRIDALSTALRALLGQAEHSIDDYDTFGAEGRHWGDPGDPAEATAFSPVDEGPWWKL